MTTFFEAKVPESTGYRYWILILRPSVLILLLAQILSVYTHAISKVSISTQFSVQDTLPRPCSPPLGVDAINLMERKIVI